VHIAVLLPLLALSTPQPSYEPIWIVDSRVEAVEACFEEGCGLVVRLLLENRGVGVDAWEGDFEWRRGEELLCRTEAAWHSDLWNGARMRVDLYLDHRTDCEAGLLTSEADPNAALAEIDPDSIHVVIAAQRPDPPLPADSTFLYMMPHSTVQDVMDSNKGIRQCLLDSHDMREQQCRFVPLDIHIQPDGTVGHVRVDSDCFTDGGVTVACIREAFEDIRFDALGGPMPHTSIWLFNPWGS